MARPKPQHERIQICIGVFKNKHPDLFNLIKETEVGDGNVSGRVANAANVGAAYLAAQSNAEEIETLSSVLDEFKEIIETLRNSGVDTANVQKVVDSRSKNMLKRMAFGSASESDEESKT